MAEIRILPEQRALELGAGETVLQGALRAGAPFTSACGGNARCSTCRVHIESGLEHCLPRNAKEAAMAAKLEFTPDLRLACQMEICGPVTVRRLALDADDAALMTATNDTVSVQRAGQEKRIAVLFSDIRGFTTLSEQLPAFDVIHVLNRYFLRMAREVEAQGGCIDNYIGDGIMALFGVRARADGEAEAKGRPENPALDAARAGLGMLTALKEFNPYLRRLYGIEFQIGIGIHVGEAVVGSVGSGKSRRTTAIGDTVNIAARIESANKDAQTSLLVSEAVLKDLGPRAQTGRKAVLPLKGKTGLFTLHELTGLAADAAPAG